MRTRNEVQDLLQQVLAHVSADEAIVNYAANTGLATRFGDNAITQNLSTREESLRLVVANGRRHGSSITNKTDADAIRDLVRRAEDIAAHSPEDPEYMPALGPQDYPEVPQRHFADAAALSPADLAGNIAGAVKLATGSGCIASGLATAGAGANAMATSKGLFAFDQSTGTSFSTTMHGPAGSGAATDHVKSAAELDAASIAQRALDTAVAAQDPRDIEPGDYTVVFEPKAVSDLLAFFTWSLDARDADEGTTPLAGQLGKQLLSDRVTLYTQIDDPEIPACPFGADGLPMQPTTWVENGVIKRLYHDRYWADRKGERPDAGLQPVSMAGGDGTVDDLVAQCDRGLLVKSLWYIRYVDARQLLLTGMTRDGLFLIENGKVTAPVKNLRFNESPIVFLRNVAALSAAERLGSTRIPGVISREFTFSSTTESV